MKNSIKSLVLLTLSLTLLASCGKEHPNESGVPSSEKGELSMALSMDNTYITLTNGKKTKASDGIDVGAFKVNLRNTDGSILKGWSAYSEIEEVVEIQAGNYEIEAYNAELKNAAFEAPYFYAKQPVKVVAQQVQNVALECKLANIKVTIFLTPKFKEAVKDILVSVDNNEKGVLPWTAEETRAGYFRVPAAKRLTVNVSGIVISDGKPIQGQSVTIDNVAAQQWHKVTLDIVTSGSMDHQITVNTELVEKDITVEIPDSDDIIDNNGDTGAWEPDQPENPDQPGDPGTPDPTPTAPEIIGASFNGAAFDLSQPVVISAANAKGTILNVVFKSTAADGLKNLKLTINSQSEMLAGMFTETMDLANPNTSSDWYSLFADPSIGIINPAEPILGKKTHTFSVGSLMELLGGLGTNLNHTFTLEVTDANGTKTAALTIKMVD